MFSRRGKMDEKGGLMNKKRTLYLLFSIFVFLFFAMFSYSRGDGIAGQIGVLENIEITKSVNILEIMRGLKMKKNKTEFLESLGFVEHKLVKFLLNWEQRKILKGDFLDLDEQALADKLKRKNNNDE